MRIHTLSFLCMLLLLFTPAAQAASLGISGTWFHYDDKTDILRINEEAGTVDTGTQNMPYSVPAEGRTWAIVKPTGSNNPADERKVIKIHNNILLVQGGGKTRILLRQNASFDAPKTKIRGLWHFAAQENDKQFYDLEFNLDTPGVTEIAGPTAAAAKRGAPETLPIGEDSPGTLALLRGNAAYYFTRLGKDFLVLRIHGAGAARADTPILLRRVGKK